MRLRTPALAVGILVSAIGLTVFKLPAQSDSATPRSAVRVTPLIPPTPVTSTGQVFLTYTVTIHYSGGTVKVAGNSGGMAQIDTDDVLRVSIQHDDQTTA